ncbi:mitochondrial outer membrane protein SLC25A46-like isoform X2 [Arctopsyche grandis]|uniref:mitochondrial outer membrane protein SLC25A46-like isoform X2 n=1 Tax=Arctopsyche grandis TaxID=121162 RepID=UPI00406D9F84
MASFDELRGQRGDAGASQSGVSSWSSWSMSQLRGPGTSSSRISANKYTAPRRPYTLGEDAEQDHFAVPSHSSRGRAIDQLTANSHTGLETAWPNDYAGIRYPQNAFPLHSDYMQDEDSEQDSLKRYMGNGLGLASLLVENLLSHPFVVLRRQCQVHNTSKKYHIVPVTLLPTVIHLHGRQGLTTLWKGIGSVCMVKGVSLAVEDCIFKVTAWPKDINNCKSLIQTCRHILLKAISIAIVTPFYCASFVETVQSDIASDKPGFFDVFKDGALRLLSWGAPSKGRMVPIWGIVMPTVAMGVAKHVVLVGLRGLFGQILKFRQRHIDDLRNTYSKNKDETNDLSAVDIDVNASLTAIIMSEIIFFPVETIIHRLYLQGTRTIIDDLDTGHSVLPVLTGYEGFLDCYQTIMSQEGFLGLYKGLGALALQFAVHIAVIKVTRWLIAEISNLLKPAVPKPALTASSSQQSLYSQQRYLIN